MGNRLEYALSASAWAGADFDAGVPGGGDSAGGSLFLPSGGATDAVGREIAHAERTVLVEAYGFTSLPIAQALVAAKRRGEEVRVTLDRSNESARHSAAPRLVEAGIPVEIDDQIRIAHAKVIVIDGETVITGSFNFTRAAEEENVENLLILRSPALARRYVVHFEERAALSRPYCP